MIATRELQLTMEGAKEIADKYISNVFGNTYFTYKGEKADDGWHFMVKCLREDMTRDPAVGSVTVFESGDVQTLSDDRIRDMKEAAEVQAAQQRREFARDEDGYVLRYHARITASSWLADYVDHKIGVIGGIFIPCESPVWKFSVCDFLLDPDTNPLDVIDVDATTGELFKPSKDQLEKILRDTYALRKHQEHQTAED